MNLANAGVVKLVDTIDSKSIERKLVSVQVRSPVNKLLSSNNKGAQMCTFVVFWMIYAVTWISFRISEIRLNNQIIRNAGPSIPCFTQGKFQCIL